MVASPEAMSTAAAAGLQGLHTQGYLHVIHHTATEISDLDDC